MLSPTNPQGLSAEGCRARQGRLRDLLRARGLHVALILNPGHVGYFTGYWNRPAFLRAALVPAEGPVVLATAIPADEIAFADEKIVFPGLKVSLLVEDGVAAAIETLLARVRKHTRLGCDEMPRPWLAQDYKLEPIFDGLWDMRRKKDADELAMIRRTIAGTQAAYALARQIIKPGLAEIDLYARIKAAATEAVREPIGEFGNDFQSGQLGGPPRDRKMEAGELFPLDLSVHLRGYWSDMCRTFCVGGKPTAKQIDARKRVLEVMEIAKAMIRPGVSARKVYQEAKKALDGHNGWSFPHHLGHGFGLYPHEAPHMNDGWDETFREGDTFTCEPGQYGPDLKGGVRIEHNFLVTANGVERLDDYSDEF